MGEKIDRFSAITDEQSALRCDEKCSVNGQLKAAQMSARDKMFRLNHPSDGRPRRYK